MTKEDIARRNQETKAKATEILNVLQASCFSTRHKFVSPPSRITTAVAEHAAASDRTEVTCHAQLVG